MGKSLAEQMAALPEDERSAILADYTDEELALLEYDANYWLRPEQIIPDGDWKITALVAGRGFGKAQDIHTSLPTPSGWKKLGDVVDGDVVFDETGKPCTVLKAHDIYTPDLAYKISFDDGTEVVADGAHLWTVLSAKDIKSNTDRLRYRGDKDPRPFPEDWAAWRSHKVRTRKVDLTEDQWNDIVAENKAGVGTRVLAKKYGISRNFITKYIDTPEAVFAGYGARTVDTTTLSEILDGDRHYIPFSGPVEYPHRDLPIEPWTFGILLGDGHTRTGQNIATHADDKQWLMTKLEERGNTVSSAHTEFPDKCSILNTGKAWKSLGLHTGKYIPSEYLTSSVEQRTELLRGLIDSDGTIRKDGRYVFTNTNKNLIDGVAELIRSLGMRATIHFREGADSDRYQKKCKDQWDVIFWSRDIVCASLPRKVIRHKATKNLRHLAREIISVTVTKPVPVRCLTVDSASRLFLVTKSYLATHNTLAMSQWVRKKAIDHPGCRIGIAARTVADLRNTVVTGESGILAVHPDHERPEYKPSTTSLHWPNGSYAQLLSSESPDSARGPQYTFAVGDEFAAWNTNVDSSGATLFSNLLMATRLQLPGGGGGQVLLATTPKRTAVMRDLMERSKRPEEKIQIIRGSTFDNTSLSKDYLDFMVRQYGNSDLAKQELMGEMIDDAEGIVFTTEMLDKAHSLKVPSNLPLRIIAVDPSVSGDPSKSDECGIVAIGSTVERDLTRRYAAVLADYSLRAAPDVWAEQVAEAARIHRTKFVVVEKNQGGQLLQMAINAKDPTLKVMLVTAKQGKLLRAEPVVIAMQQGRVALADYFPELEDQMLFYDPEASSSPDRLDAMVWGIISCLITPPDGLYAGSFRGPKTGGGRRIPTGGIGMGSHRTHFRAPREPRKGR